MTTLAKAYVHRCRAYRVPFGVTLPLALYAHKRALFLAIALVIAAGVAARAAPRDAAADFGIAAALYTPWLPTLLFQSRHTGAPWAIAPAASALVEAPAERPRRRARER